MPPHQNKRVSSRTWRFKLRCPAEKVPVAQEFLRTQFPEFLSLRKAEADLKAHIFECLVECNADGGVWDCAVTLKHSTSIQDVSLIRLRSALKATLKCDLDFTVERKAKPEAKAELKPEVKAPAPAPTTAPGPAPVEPLAPAPEPKPKIEPKIELKEPEIGIFTESPTPPPSPIQPKPKPKPNLKPKPVIVAPKPAPPTPPPEPVAVPSVRTFQLWQ